MLMHLTHLSLLSMIAFGCVSVNMSVFSETTGTNCKTSYDCGKGFCCRDAQSRILSSQPRLKGILGSYTGTCVMGKAAKGEVCDTDCRCDMGLTCYRPMSGFCCPATTCHDSAYVLKQQEYWRNCLSNPKCSLPR